MIEHWIASGQVAACIIGLTALEALALAAFRRLRRVLPTLLAGDFVLLAWFLSAAHWQLAGLALLGALAAHTTDMLRRMG